MFIHAHAALTPKKSLEPFTYTSEFLDSFAIEVEVTHCGLCHSDLHLIDNDWGTSMYPLVPGHEIIGKIIRIGSAVKSLKIGQRVGVSWQHGSCLTCVQCLNGDENLCSQKTCTCVGHYGGFADRMIADSRFAYPLPDDLSSENAGPLMCAGATVFAPLQHYFQDKKGTVGIIGIGGLGHLALQFARALGHQVIAISHTTTKKDEAMHFGAHTFLDSNNTLSLKEAVGSCDFLLNTANADADWNIYLNLLKPKGTLCFVGKPPHNLEVSASLLISGQKQISGSTVSNRRIMREMLNFAATNTIIPLIEVFPMNDINHAIEKLRKGEIRYRAVMKN